MTELSTSDHTQPRGASCTAIGWKGASCPLIGQ